MKKSIKILIIVALIAIALSAGYVYYKKYKDSDNLRPEYDHFRPTDAGWAAKLLMGGFDAEIGFKLSNYSTSTFKVNQVVIDVYTIDGTLIASPTHPMSGTFTINPQEQPILNLDYYITKEGIVKTLESVGKTSADLLNLAKNYLLYSKLGVKLLIKGYLVAEGIQLLKIPIEKVIDI